jgi:hypothetical protein
MDMFRPLLVNALRHGKRVTNWKSVFISSCICLHRGPGTQKVALQQLSEELSLKLYSELYAVPFAGNAACVVTGCMTRRGGMGLAPRSAPV